MTAISTLVLGCDLTRDWLEGESPKGGLGDRPPG